MEKLKKAYEALDMFKALALPVSDEQLFAIKKLEKEYLETEIMPLLKEELYSLVKDIRNKFNLEIKFDPDNGVNIAFKNSTPPQGAQTTLFDDNDFARRVQTTIKVKFPDGKVIYEREAGDSFFNTITAIGVERVKKLDLFLYNVPLITDTLDDRYYKSQREVENGLYVATHGDTKSKVRVLETISDRLNLDLDIETVAKSGSNKHVVRNKKPTETPHRSMTVHFQDGTTIGPTSGNKAFALSIDKIGVEDAARVQMNFGRRLLVSQTPFSPGRGYSLGNGWHVYTDLNNTEKRDYLLSIAKELKVELTIDLGGE